jgi:hypothetical protein
MIQVNQSGRKMIGLTFAIDRSRSQRNARVNFSEQFLRYKSRDVSSANPSFELPAPS